MFFFREYKRRIALAPPPPPQRKKAIVRVFQSKWFNCRVEYELSSICTLISLKCSLNRMHVRRQPPRPRCRRCGECRMCRQKKWETTTAWERNACDGENTKRKCQRHRATQPRTSCNEIIENFISFFSFLFKREWIGEGGDNGTLTRKSFFCLSSIFFRIRARLESAAAASSSSAFGFTFVRSWFYYGCFRFLRR